MEIAIISGKGGTGKSSISAAFMSLIPDVIAVDCDVDASNLYLLFDSIHDHELSFESGKHATVDRNICIGCGRCAESCRFDAISMQENLAVIDGIGCDGCALCTHVCSVNAITMITVNKSRIYTGTFRYGRMVYGRLAPGEENSGKMVNELRRLSKKIAENDSCPIIIIDGPPGIGCPVLSTIVGVDRVLVVTEPSLSGFSDLKRTIKLVRSYSIPVNVIINKYTLNEKIAEEISCWCNEEEISIVGFLPFDVEMVKALVAKQTIIEYDSDSKIVETLKSALSEIIGNY